MKTHIIKNGVVVNTILATVQEAATANPDAICISGEIGAIGWAWDGENLISPPTLPNPVPESVTRRQAKQALAINGKLSLVQPAIDAIPDPAQRTLIQIEWDDSQEFQRNRASVIGIGTAIGLDSAGIDALFRQAVTL